jgi:hypothetical protein
MGARSRSDREITYRFIPLGAATVAAKDSNHRDRVRCAVRTRSPRRPSVRTLKVKVSRRHGSSVSIDSGRSAPRRPLEKCSQVCLYSPCSPCPHKELRYPGSYKYFTLKSSALALKPSCPSCRSLMSYPINLLTSDSR